MRDTSCIRKLKFEELLFTKNFESCPDFWDGTVLLLNKPYGLTSFKVVHEIRSAITRGTGKKLKIGHAGTLDPLASGLLILATGKMTKEIDRFQALTKVYSGRFHLGFTRPSYDMETPIMHSSSLTHITTDQIESVRQQLTGSLMIPPPAHSAIKLAGKRAYQLARQGEELELEPKLMHILQFDLDVHFYPEIKFKVVCSKGTYIRSLAHEFGLRLGCGAYLSALKREAIGQYDIEDAWDFFELKEFLSGNTKR